MTVFLVVEQHRAEGMQVLAVYDAMPSDERVRSLPSCYDQEERDHWCERTVLEYEVKKP